MAEEIEEMRNNEGSMAGGAAVGTGSESSSLEMTLEMTRYLYERVEKKEEQIQKSGASVFQVANYYFVFQGVILTAIIKGSTSGLKCQYFWLPLSLSAIGAVLNFGTLVIIVIEYRAGLDELDKRSRILYDNLYRNSPSKSMLKQHQRNKAWRKGYYGDIDIPIAGGGIKTIRATHFSDEVQSNLSLTQEIHVCRDEDDGKAPLLTLYHFDFEVNNGRDLLLETDGEGHLTRTFALRNREGGSFLQKFWYSVIRATRCSAQIYQ